MTSSLLQLTAAPDLVEQVYSRLLDAISEGTLPPGERLTQEDLAQRLAVSRQPVLQALRLLKKDGFVEDAPGRGVRVTQLDIGWIAQVYQVRGSLDALAVRLAAEHGARLDEGVMRQGRLAESGRDVQAMIQADLAFHRAIYQASGNPLIAHSIELHWHHLKRVMGAVLQSSQQRQTVWDDHEAIAHAISTKDADLAVRLVQEHADKASVQLTARLTEQIQNLKTGAPHEIDPRTTGTI
ncbi:GntR family transcriptional regulator [Limnohabitans sp.]|jgi:DNA-binding GntR family transcriptional regulator|uniref:GntR family transcriptional regulator n=1 Tax=Limnohabitans sp. TaxID=1907725 RepID=UPI0037BE889F